MTKVALLAAMLAACGTDPKAIDLAIPGTQMLVTEKVNGGAWKKLSGQFDGDANATTYSIEIGDEYELAVVCIRSGPTDAGQFVAGEVFGTSDDPEVTLGSWESPNCVNNAATPRVTISGTFDETMDFSVGGGTIHSTAGHRFAFTTPAGRRDLVAYSNTKLLIQRDLQLDTDMTLAPVHVASDGTAMLAVAVPVGGDVDEQPPFVYDTLTTRSGTAFSWWMDEDPDAALFVPPSMLEPGDVQTFAVELSTPTGNRSITVADPTRVGDAPLLPRIASSTFHAGGFGITWTPISEFYTTATVRITPTRDSWQSVTASRLWLERHGKNTLDFDLTVDGYDPSWTSTSTPTLALERWSPGLVVTTGISPTEAM